MGAAIVLLLLGTQILDWYWPVILFLGSLGLGLYRLRNRVPANYTLLQAVDHRLALSDALSTAYYFGKDHPTRHASEEVRHGQLRNAEAHCHAIDVAQAIPFRLSSSALVAAFLLVAAVTLFGVRYGVRNSLDLGPPITQALFEFYRPTTLTEEAAAAAPEPEQVAAEMARAEGREGRLEPDSEAALSAEDTGETDAEGLSPSSDRALEGDELAEGEEQPGDGRDEGGDSPERSSDAGGQDPTSAPPAGDREEGSGEKPPPFPPDQDSDLIRKMQDAFANLLSKLKIPPRAGEGQRLAKQRGNQPGQSGEQEQAKGRRMPGGEQQEGTPSEDASGQRSAEPGSQSRTGQGQAGNQVSDQPGQQQARSGMGTKEGEKDVKLAEQLEAMGKLSEIIGRRAENITGEVMVEVTSGDQRLRTRYQQRDASHRDAGGEVHRDEIPLELRDYVQRYFEQVHKQPPDTDG